MGQDVLRTSLCQNPALGQDVGAVADTKCLADVVVGDQDPDLHVPKIADQFLNIDDRDGVNAGEGLVEQHERWPERNGPGDLNPTSFSTREAVAIVGGLMADAELLEHLIHPLMAGIAVESRDGFQHREQVVPHRETAKDGRFLGQVSDAFACTLVHGEPTDVLSVEQNRAPISAHETANHVKAGRFSSAVRAEQADDFTATDGDIDIVHDCGLAKLLDQALGGECAHESVSRRDCFGTD